MFRLEWLEPDGEVNGTGPFWTRESAESWAKKNIGPNNWDLLPIERNGHTDPEEVVQECRLVLELNGQVYRVKMLSGRVSLFKVGDSDQSPYVVSPMGCTCLDSRYRGRQRPCKHQVACKKLGLL